MRLFLPLALAGVSLGLFEGARRRVNRRNSPTLSRDWKAFIEAKAAKGEPEIKAARVPSVKPLRGVKENQFETFRRRFGGL